MIRESIRLTVRMHRFELIALAVATAVLVAAALLVAGHLDSVGFGPCAAATESTRHCDALAQTFYGIDQREASPVLSFIAMLPYAAGLFLGGPLIAREIERGTTRLAWSISPSRFRWYLARLLPIVAAVLVLTFVAGVAADRLIAARTPGTDMTNAFDAYGTRGLLVAVTALVMTAGAVGLGAVIGRVLPTVILALVLGSLGLTAVSRFHERFTAGEAVIVESDAEVRGARYIDQFFKLPDGRLVGWEELYGLYPDLLESESGPPFPTVALIIPGSRYREVETRETAGLGLIAVVMLAGTAVIVQRRRPG